MKSQQQQIDELKATVDRLARELSRVNARNANPSLKKQASLIVKPASTIAKGDTGTCRVFTVLEEDTTIDIEAIALGAEVTGGLYALAWKDICGRFAVGPWECP